MILEKNPHISREWLYFDEGEMLQSVACTNTASLSTALVTAKAELTAARAEIVEVRRKYTLLLEETKDVYRQFALGRDEEDTYSGVQEPPASYGNNVKGPGA